MAHFCSFDQRIMVKNYHNKQHKDKSMETVENNLQSFLDTYKNIIRENSKCVTSVYGKPTLGGVFTNLESFIPETHKRGSIEICLHISFRLCSNCENFLL